MISEFAPIGSWRRPANFMTNIMIALMVKNNIKALGSSIDIDIAMYVARKRVVTATITCKWVYLRAMPAVQMDCSEANVKRKM